MGQWRQTSTESQKFPRVSTAVPVRVTTVEPEIDPTSGETFFRSTEETTANLSQGGAYVRSWEPLAAGRRVVLAIDLAPGRELQLVGRVAWTRRELRPKDKHALEAPGYGVEFVGESSADLAELERYLASFQPRTSPEPAHGPALAPARH